MFEKNNEVTRDRGWNGGKLVQTNTGHHIKAARCRLLVAYIEGLVRLSRAVTNRDSMDGDRTVGRSFQTRCVRGSGLRYTFLPFDYYRPLADNTLAMGRTNFYRRAHAATSTKPPVSRYVESLSATWGTVGRLSLGAVFHELWSPKCRSWDVCKMDLVRFGIRRSWRSTDELWLGFWRRPLHFTVPYRLALKRCGLPVPWDHWACSVRR